MKALSVTLLILLGLTGCQTTAPKLTWKHASIDEIYWARDHRSCKRQVDQYLALNPDNHALTDIGERNMYQDTMRSFRVSKKQKSLVSSCMRKKGYEPA